MKTFLTLICIFTLTACMGSTGIQGDLNSEGSFGGSAHLDFGTYLLKAGADVGTSRAQAINTDAQEDYYRYVTPYLGFWLPVAPINTQLYINVGKVYANNDDFDASSITAGIDYFFKEGGYYSSMGLTLGIGFRSHTFKDDSLERNNMIFFRIGLLDTTGLQ
jgi:hypothetical protein